MHLFTHVRAKVALLFAGAFLWGAQAYADEGAYYQQFLLSFEDKDTYTDGWTRQTEDLSWEHEQLSDGTYALRLNLQENKNARTFSYDFSKITAFTNAVNYQFEFDWGSSAPNNNNTPSSLTLAGSTSTIFTISQVYNATTGTLTYGDNSLSLTLDGATKACPTIIYHFVVKSSAESGLTLAITQKDGTSVLEETKVTDHQTIAEISGKVGRYQGQMLFDEIKLSEYKTGDVVENPIVSNSGESYASKTVTITCATEGATIKYTINGGEEQTTNPFTIDETSTIVAWAEKGDVKSEEVTVEVKAGEIATPTFYRPIGVGSNNSLEIACETSAATILYKVDNGEEQTYTSAITIDAANTISAKAVYEENGKTYSSEESEIEIAGPLNLTQSRIIDFSLSARGSGEIVPTLSDEAAVTINSADYYTFTMGDYGLIEDFVVGYVEPNGTSGNKWWLRKDLTGLYLYASSNTNFALLNVKAGQYVKITGHVGQSNFSLTLNNDVAKLISLSSQETDKETFYVYQVTKDGDLALRMSKTSYLDNIQILDGPIGVAVSSVGYSTFYTDHATVIPDDVEAYVGALTTDQSALKLTSITDKVIPANTAVILKANEGTYTFEPTDDVDPIEGNELLGTMKALAAADIEGQVYVLSHKDGKNVGFYKFSGETLAANKAYLVLPAAETAPMVRFNFDEGNVGNVTGIESIDAENGAQARIFDLQGRSLRQAPQKGMYILNGHKVIR